MSEEREVWLTDLRPAIGSRGKAIPYSLAGRQGYLLRLEEEDRQVHALPSPFRGWCEIHLGFLGASGIQVRVAGEPAFRWVESSVQWDRRPEEGEEAFWKIAWVSREGFEFLPQRLPRRADQRVSQIAYLRLVPLAEGEAHRRLEEARRRPTRTAGAVIDGHELLGAYAPQSPAEVCAMIEPFQESDFRRLHFGCTCTTMRMVYLTKVGYYLGQDQRLEDLHSEVNRRCAWTLQKAAREGWDPLAAMIEYCRTNDLELWVDFRIQQDYPFDYAGGFGFDFNSPFAEAHQDWRHVDRHGQVCSHLFSHFHPGWEEYKLALLAELAEKGPAGIHLNLMCEMGALWDFAPTAVARFREECGLDPTATAEPPLAWYQFRCDHLTEFMRRLRRQTDEIGRRLGRRLPLAAQVSGEWSILREGKRISAVSQNFLAGFDIGRWAREGLVDVISPSFRRTYRPLFLEHLEEELGASRRQVQVIPSIGQHDNALFPWGYEWSLYFTDEGEGSTGLVPFGELDGWRVLREAHDLYQQGADAVEVWEMGHAPVRLDRWNILKQIGDRKMLAKEFGTRIKGLLGRPAHPLVFALSTSGNSPRVA